MHSNPPRHPKALGDCHVASLLAMTFLFVGGGGKPPPYDFQESVPIHSTPSTFRNSRLSTTRITGLVMRLPRVKARLAPR